MSGDVYYPSVDQRRADNGGTTYTLNHPHGADVAAIEHDYARVTVYLHTPENGAEPYLVVEVDKAESDTRVRVLVDDVLRHDLDDRD